MKLKFENLCDELKPGVEYIKETLRFETGEGGIPVNVSRGDKIMVSLSQGKGQIVYNEKHHFFRALGLFLENAKKADSFSICEQPNFKTVGVMLDASRNGVMTVESIKKYLRYMAVMGMNMLMMYTEDTYEVPEAPYFGYMRGRYTKQELSECDDYAYALGIEMIPCIQTLGHMEQYLKWWRAAAPIRDTTSVLLVGAPETYEFIEQMIKAASAPFRSKRIHIGSDEAWDMGLGNYLKKNGYRNPFDVFVEHLNRVIEITNKYGLKPMMWSDMFFRIGSKRHEYYDIETQIPKEVKEKIPPEVQLVYWDYYHADRKVLERMFDIHESLNREIIFAGGIWTWCGMLPDNRFTKATTDPALEISREKGIKEVIATVWGDNGCETDQMMSVWGMQLFAEHAYSKNVDEQRLKERFEFCTGGDYDAFLEMSDFHGPFSEDVTSERIRVGKKILWTDVLLGQMDDYLAKNPMSSYYEKLYNEMRRKLSSGGEWQPYYEYATAIFELVSRKCFIAERLKAAYDKKDKDFLTLCANEYLPDLLASVKNLRKIHKKQWYSVYKPFGWEVIEIRYGGLIARIETAIERIAAYVENEVDSLPELEEKRLAPELGQYNYGVNATACNGV